MPQKFLITGASGYIGRNLCAELSSSGHHVIGAIRSPDNQGLIADQGAHSWICPPVENADFPNSLNSNVDVVVHLAAHVHQFDRHDDSETDLFHAINVVGTENAAKLAIRRGASLFILASTVAVFGDRSGTRPLDSTSSPNPITAYARSKHAAERAAENLLGDTDLSMKILRIPMVYGQDAPGNFSKLCKLIATGLPLPIGSATSKRSFLYISNLTHAIQTIIASPEKCPRIALIADDTAISTAAMVRTVAGAMGTATKLFPFPKKLLEVASYVVGRHQNYVSLFEPMEINSTEFRSAMNWSAPYDTGNALRRSIPSPRTR